MISTTPRNISDPNHNDLDFLLFFYFLLKSKLILANTRCGAKSSAIAIHSLIRRPTIGSQLRAKERALAIRVAQDHPGRARGSSILSSN